MAVTHANILGVMSLIFWSLTMVVTVKYVTFILKADNDGEGGIYALAALFLGKGANRFPNRRLNISCCWPFWGSPALWRWPHHSRHLGALGGGRTDVATTAFESYVLPITCAILIGLFMVQRQGTARIGKVFGLIMLLWFFSLATLGLMQVLRMPEILAALDPRHAVAFFATNRLHGMVVLGAVVLVITGGEALYADMGHFGRGPVQLSWLTFVFPALVLNYFGQCAFSCKTPRQPTIPFTSWCPGPCSIPWWSWPPVATIIASQAMISGVIPSPNRPSRSVTYPGFISSTPPANQGPDLYALGEPVMLIGCLGLAIAFKESSRLAAAYGIAVTGTMGITTLIYYYVARYNWGWPLWKVMLPVSFSSFSTSPILAPIC